MVGGVVRILTLIPDSHLCAGVAYPYCYLLYLWRGFHWMPGNNVLATKHGASQLLPDKFCMNVFRVYTEAVF